MGAAPSRRKEPAVGIHEQTARAGLSEGTARALVRFVRVVFPHDRFPDGPYRRVVEKLDADAAGDAGLAGMLEQGVRDLDAAHGRPFADLADDDARRLVEQSAGSAMFEKVRASAVVTLYDQPEVWELLGYEGPSFELGGYARRGFDDLDWLPDPPV
jgi:hypothetical protein